jgi:uncharacterized protein (TIGR00369 family)
VTLRRLDNRTWEFESRCFVCDSSNETGLGLAFYADDEAGAVVAEFTLDDRFSGTPKYVHGGITLAVLDEAMAWAAIALAGRFAVTRTTTARFVRPVKVDRPYRVSATLTGRNDDGSLALAATVADPSGRVCVEAQAEFVPLSAARARSAIGEVRGDDASFVRG